MNPLRHPIRFRRYFWRRHGHTLGLLSGLAFLKATLQVLIDELKEGATQ